MFYCTSILVMYWKLIGNDMSTCQYKFEADTFNVWHIVELQASKEMCMHLLQEREKDKINTYLCVVLMPVFFTSLWIKNLFAKDRSFTNVFKFEDLKFPSKMKHFWNNFDCTLTVPRLQIEDDMKKQ
jgi:hypothetical protein